MASEADPDGGLTGKNIVFPAWILYNDPRLITTKSTVNFVNSLSTWEILGSTWDRCTKPRVNPGLEIRYFFLWLWGL